jgi:ABC-type Zn uptake system ZnuABC Zn-binding protein ZnuA
VSNPLLGRPRGSPIVVAFLVASLGIAAVFGGCAGIGSATAEDEGSHLVVADTSYLADIAQNVAGDRMTIGSLLPPEADPHSFEPSPGDARIIAESRAIIINSYGLSPLVDDLIASAGGRELLVIEAAAGLPGRVPQDGEAALGEQEIDPHFWLDPTKVIHYVENIRDGLAAVDPDGAEAYRSNAESYARRLKELDSWIQESVDTIPLERRLLVTNHQSFGYFADRYGFRIVGSVFPTAGGEGIPSAQQLAALVEKIEATGAPAIFLETGSNSDLADQLARETGVKVVADLHTHSLGEDGPTYVDMMRWDVERIVEALR